MDLSPALGAPSERHPSHSIIPKNSRNPSNATSSHEGATQSSVNNRSILPTRHRKRPNICNGPDTKNRKPEPTVQHAKYQSNNSGNHRGKAANHFKGRRRIVEESDDSDNDVDAVKEETTQTQPKQQYPMKKRNAPLKTSPLTVTKREVNAIPEPKQLITAPIAVAKKVLKEQPTASSGLRNNKVGKPPNPRQQPALRNHQKQIQTPKSPATEQPSGQGSKPRNARAKRSRTQNRESRTRKPRYRRIIPFVDKLPGEVRNMIYEFVAVPIRLMICVNKPALELANLKRRWEYEGIAFKQQRARLYSLLDREQLAAGLDISTGLLYVNKQISMEFRHFVYSRTTFCFASLKVLSRFCQTASQQGLSSIERLELQSNRYGEPYLTKNRIYKLRSDEKWDKMCELIGTRLPSLTHFKLHARCLEWPMKDIEETAWHDSLMRVVQHRKLHDVKMFVVHPRLSQKKLERVRQKLEIKMMTAQGLQEREDRELQRHLRQIQQMEAAEAERRAQSLSTIKCLRITLGGSAGQTEE